MHPAAIAVTSCPDRISPGWNYSKNVASAGGYVEGGFTARFAEYATSSRVSSSNTALTAEGTAARTAPLSVQSARYDSPLIPMRSTSFGGRPKNTSAASND